MQVSIRRFVAALQGVRKVSSRMNPLNRSGFGVLADRSKAAAAQRCALQALSSLGRHADGAIKANHLAVEVAVFEDVQHKSREFFWPTKARGEWDHFPKGVLYFGRHGFEHRRLHDSG